MARERHGKDFELISSDVAVAIFTHGLNSDSVKEKLASKELKDIKSAYQDAVLYEDVSQDFNKAQKRSYEPEQQTRKRFKPQGSDNYSDGNEEKRFPEKRQFERNSNNFVRPKPGYNQGNSQSLVCFKCNKPGHYAKDCRSTRVGAITLLDNEVEFVRTNKSSTVLAKVGLTNVHVTIDSGADTNCISLSCAEAAGIKEMQKVKAPEIRFAGNNTAEPLGMITVPIQFHKNMEAVPVKFLVFKELVPKCLLGIDGQDQLKIRLDRQQDLVWIAGMPISLNCSQQEAQVNLGAVHLSDAFQSKMDKVQNSKRFTTYYSTNIELDPLVSKTSMSFEMLQGSAKEVNVEPSLSDNDKDMINKYVNEHEYMFGYFEKDGYGASTTTAVSHRVVTDGTIVSAKPYRLSMAQREIVEREIDEMLSLGIIRPSQSGYASPVVLVPKPDKSWRFCVDYRKLNQHTKSDKYPLPNIDECLSRMKGAKYFAKLDLAAGYWQIPMHEADVEKTAFVTPLGLYEFTVMPFGLKTAPATFQRMMDRLVGDMNNVLIYLDDILIYAKSINELLENMSMVFKKLASVNLKLRAKKCSIGMQRINYLGYVVSDKGIEVDRAKVSAIKDMDAPTSVRGVRRFLGMASYYRNFVYQFAFIANPLTKLISKNARFYWSDECQGAFDKLKDLLCESPVLKHPDYKEPFAIFTDASNYGVGAVLTQGGQPVWFSSRTLNPAEIKYDTREKECIAVMYGLDKFKPYFYGGPITVFTDHGNLRWLMEHEQKGRLARWQLFLQQFDFQVSYVKGINNPVADCLSRDLPPVKKTMAVGAVTTILTSDKDSEAISTKPKVEVVITRPLKFENINWEKQQIKDPYIKHILDDVKEPFVIKDKLLYRYGNDNERTKLVVPSHLVQLVLKKAHDSELSAHGGVKKTCFVLRSYWFPSFRNTIEQYCKQCMVCINAKGFGKKHSHLSTREPLDMLERVFIDVVGPLPNDTSSYGNDARYILTMMDDGSRFLKVASMKNCKRESIIKEFKEHWIGVFGKPYVIVTDNNQQFKGEFSAMCSELEVLQEFTAPYSPEMNAVERVHGTLMNKLRALRYSMQKPWTECLPIACLSYNLGEHSMTGYAPFALLFAKDVDILNKSKVDIDNISKIRDTARTQAYSKRRRRVLGLNENVKEQDITAGDKVLVRAIDPTKLENRVLEDVFLVKKQEARNIYAIEAENGRCFRRSKKDIYKLK